MKKLKINKVIKHCEDCVFCTWNSMCCNTGWYCAHFEFEYDKKLILVKEDYDASGPKFKHVYIPKWCPLDDEEKKGDEMALTKVDKLKEWLNKLAMASNTGGFTSVVKVTEDSISIKKDIVAGDENHHKYKVYLYTKSRKRYMILGIDRPNDEGYLGSQVSNTYPLAGEDWTRGDDLPDGPFNEETWYNILSAIVGNELQELGT